MWTSDFVTVNGLRIHYLRTGGSKPALVLAHGGTANGRSWTRVASALVDTFDVIAPDARGHGLTDAPAGEYSFTTLGNDLAGFIQVLGLDNPIVGGASLGANTVLSLVADHPDIARAAILEDPIFFLQSPEATQHWIATAVASLRAEAISLANLGLDGTVERFRLANPHWSDAELENAATAKLQVRDVFFTTFRDRFDWQAMLGRVHCPVLLVTGDPERGALVTAEAAAVAKRCCPTLEVAHMPDASHNINSDQFDRYLAALRGFLSRVS
ncbi:MAG: alpha/beta hydrolase [Proteobacteria bacterium]|jgi:N-formylmaleamate deformylase|nr:alpha/beta hydrolase [Pseudomonadota bacterium]HAH16691.1 alpha/beta hydrolase [Chloroflexota bacterium]NBT03767.1 alpha/beta hydrolase [Pseudomonadota bacterium]NBT19114.1 alpha/beta hydrolase [Pseudomonadota bacterium]NBY47004.1 alpha/beta hydrolase [Pseudomonadota bacterium]